MTNEQAFEKICGNNVGIQEVTADDIRLMAEQWNAQGETCTDEEIEAAIKHINLIQDNAFVTIECPHCNEQFEIVSHGDTECIHCGGIVGV